MAGSGVCFDSSVTGDKRGSAHEIVARLCNSDSESLSPVQLPRVSHGRADDFICSQVDTATIYTHKKKVMGELIKDDVCIDADSNGLLDQGGEDVSLGSAPDEDPVNNNYSFLHWNIDG